MSVSFPRTGIKAQKKKKIWEKGEPFGIGRRERKKMTNRPNSIGKRKEQTGTLMGTSRGTGVGTR